MVLFKTFKLITSMIKIATDVMENNILQGTNPKYWNFKKGD